MKKLLLISIWLIPLLANSQDLIILRNGTNLKCKITRTDSVSIFFSFQRNNQEVASFIGKNEVRSYSQFLPSDTLVKSDKGPLPSQEFVLDTTPYVRDDNRWNNLITYSGKYGIAASGWSLQYYGYTIHKDKRWIVPCVFEYEKLVMNENYVNDYYYQAARLNYMMAGISPFRRLNDYFYFNLGFRVAFGNERLTNRSGQMTNGFLFGAALSEGIYFIPKSNFGITCGLGFYEKAFYSKFYPQDLGFRWELGLKF